MSQLCCPICSSELSLAQLFVSDDARIAVARLVLVSVPMGARVLQYATLFAPPKTRLTVPKQIKLIVQLLPDLERRAITYKGRDWAVPLELWARGIDQMLSARDAGRLELPMSGHGYLYAILAGLADKSEGAAEAQREADRRAPAGQGQVTVAGQTMSIGQGLAQVYGGRDPALTKLDRDNQKAAPMPEAVRARLAELRGGRGAPATHTNHLEQ